MHRNHLLALLAAHSPTDEKEGADVAFIQDFVRTHANCFGKANPLGHITGSAYIIDPTGRFLLTHHAKLKRWLQVGGHSDPHEHDPLQTALREAQEESGLADLAPLQTAPIDIDVHRIPERRKGDRFEPAHDHLDIRYALLTRAPEQIAITAESLDLGWFTLDELPGVGLDPAALRAARKTHACWRATRRADGNCQDQ